MALDAARDQRDALRDEQRAGAVLHHLARALERGKRLLERRALALLDLEALRQLLAREQARPRGSAPRESRAGVLRARRRGRLCALRAPRALVFLAFSLTLGDRFTRISPPCRGGGIGRH